MNTSTLTPAPSADDGALRKAPAKLALAIAVLLLIHLSGDIIYGFERGETIMALGVLAAGAWLAAVLAFGPRAGYVLVLLLACVAPVVPLIHMSGTGIADDISGTDFGVFLFVCSTVSLGAIAPVSVVLSIKGLWRLRRGMLSFLLQAAVPTAVGACLLAFVLLT
jgi:hypothetical protein